MTIRRSATAEDLNELSSELRNIAIGPHRQLVLSQLARLDDSEDSEYDSVFMEEGRESERVSSHAWSARLG